MIFLRLLKNIVGVILLVLSIFMLKFYFSQKTETVKYTGKVEGKKEFIIAFLIFLIPSWLLMVYDYIITRMLIKQTTTLIIYLGLSLLGSGFLALVINVILFRDEKRRIQLKQIKEFKKTSKVLEKVNVLKDVKNIFIALYLILVIISFSQKGAEKEIINLLVNFIWGYWVFVFAFIDRDIIIDYIAKRKLVKKLEAQEIEKNIYDIGIKKGHQILLMPITNSFIRHIRYRGYLPIQLKLVFKDIYYYNTDNERIKKTIEYLIEKYPVKPNIKISNVDNNLGIICVHDIVNHGCFSVLDEFFIIYEMLEELANELIS